eukprot:GILK01011181.1.p1 GENE.GILK01011181.1~~GILK01011181.1.p1  ORF type:complete len:417 (+),score=48.13 GILK01011181.1:142-1392(+)
MGNQQTADAGRNGFRVLKIQSNSPAEKAGIVPFFDFIVAADDQPTTTEDAPLSNVIRQHVNRPLKLSVYNCRAGIFRNLLLTPSSNWGGDGLLGATIRFDSYQNVEENVLRVLDVFAESPAALAGLEPFTDYILGTRETVFKSLDDLATAAQAMMQQPMHIYVYSSRTDTVREVVIVPNNEWGGQGCIGCDIGHGYLHRLPLLPMIHSAHHSPSLSPSKTASTPPFIVGQQQEHAGHHHIESGPSAATVALPPSPLPSPSHPTQQLPSVSPSTVSQTLPPPSSPVIPTNPFTQTSVATPPSLSSSSSPAAVPPVTAPVSHAPVIISNPFASSMMPSSTVAPPSPAPVPVSVPAAATPAAVTAPSQLISVSVGSQPMYYPPSQLSESYTHHRPGPALPGAIKVAAPTSPAPPSTSTA